MDRLQACQYPEACSRRPGTQAARRSRSARWAWTGPLAYRSRYWSLSWMSLNSSASGSGDFVLVMLGQLFANSALSAVNCC